MQLYYGVQATVSVIRNSEVVRYSGVSIVLYIYGDCSWCMQRCPLFGRCPLLGVSVNRESTVVLCPKYKGLVLNIMVISDV